MIPTNVLIASIATLVILLNGTFLMFPKSRPADILMKIFCGVAVYFWTMAIFGPPSKTAYIVSGILALIGFLIGPLKSMETTTPKSMIMEPIKVQSSTDTAELPFMGKTGKVFCQSGEKNGYLGILDENSDSILVYCNETLEDEDRFIISDVKDGRIIVDKIK